MITTTGGWPRLLTRPQVALALAILVAFALVPAHPAAAIIGGSPDGGVHPYVGAVDGRPVGGPVKFGSGVLISPTVLLTVGHGTARFDSAGLTRARVTFDSTVTEASTWFEGTVHTNPAYDPAGSGNRGDFGDLGVIVFDAPIPGVTPAQLPPAGYLDDLAREPGRARFEIPGYGISRYEGGSDGGRARRPDPNSGGTRTLAEAAFASLSPGFLRLSVTDRAAICTGDSGSPSIRAGTNVVAGVTAVEWSLDGSQCESNPWEQRVDTPGARAFLSQYVSVPQS